MGSISHVVERMLTLRSKERTILVAVDGLGGAGKTTLSTSIASTLERSGEQVVVIHFDDFYLPASRRPKGKGADAPIGGNFDWCRLRDEVLVPLREGRTASYARYDWERDVHADTLEVRPGGIVIVEGVGSSRTELTPFYDLRVWVDCSREERLTRGIARDGQSSKERWLNDWMPNEQRYLCKHRPDVSADIIVSGEVN